MRAHDLRILVLKAEEDAIDVGIWCCRWGGCLEGTMMRETGMWSET